MRKMCLSEVFVSLVLHNFHGKNALILAIYSYFTLSRTTYVAVCQLASKTRLTD